MEGFLNFAINGLKRLLENNSFSNSETFEAVKEKWINQSDSFKAFAGKNLVIDYDGEIEKQQLKFDYHNYCKENKVKPLSDKHIYNILTLDYAAEIKQKKLFDDVKRVWVGVKFK